VTPSNKHVRNTDPWGTLEMTGNDSEVAPLMSTCCCCSLLVRLLWTQCFCVLQLLH